MAHGDFKDLPRRTASDRVLCRFFQCFIKFLEKFAAAHANKSASANTSSGAIKSKIISNQQLAQELQKLIIRKFEKQKIYSSFKDDIWGVDIADM